MTHECRVHTAVGNFLLAEQDGAIVRIDFCAGCEPAAEPDTPALREAARQLTEYAEGRRRAFELKLNPSGTEFQRAVWAALQDIPYGETRSYADIAKAVGRPGAARAVGGANHANPIPVVIPCHRVVRTGGDMGGYGGGIDMKKRLLELEHKA